MLKGFPNALGNTVPLEGFEYEKLGAIRRAAASEIPGLMVVAGPNGVGKSTLFEEINKNIQSNRVRPEIESADGVQSLYLSPHRAPAPSNMSASLLSTLGRESSRSQLGSSTYNLNSSELPNVVRYADKKRSRKRADFAPFFELKRRLPQLEFDRGQLMADLYDSEGRGLFRGLKSPVSVAER